MDDATERRCRREGCRLAEDLALRLDMCVCRVCVCVSCICVYGSVVYPKSIISFSHRPPIIVFLYVCVRRGRLAATTALVFFHRFYTRNSFKHHDRLVRGPSLPPINQGAACLDLVGNPNLKRSSPNTPRNHRPWRARPCCWRGRWRSAPGSCGMWRCSSCRRCSKGSRARRRPTARCGLGVYGWWTAVVLSFVGLPITHTYIYMYTYIYIYMAINQCTHPQGFADRLAATRQRLAAGERALLNGR